jgi:hypothetical protein
VERAVQDRATVLGLGPIQAVTPTRNPEAEKIVARFFLGVPVSALYWCDGKRNLAQVVRLTELEMGPQQFDFVGNSKFLEMHAYVEFVR